MKEGGKQEEKGADKETVLEIWGTRGSLAVSGPEYEEYGGNTSCISIRTAGRVLILDAGTGISRLGRMLAEEGFRGRADLFLSHVHLDHILGLATFPLLFSRDVKLVIHGEARMGKDIRQQLNRIFEPPYWPVCLEQAQADIGFQTIGEGQHLDLGDGIAVDTFRARHPDQCLMLKISAGNSTMVYATDCEMDREFIRKAAEFARGSRLIIADAQYAPEELEKKRGWGHSSWMQGNLLARSSGADWVIHTHFDWSADDICLSARESQAAEDWEGAVFAREGMRIQL